MKGNTLNDFINDLLTMGGPEKEFLFREKRFFLETTLNETNLFEMCIFEVSATDDIVFTCTGKTFQECTEKFEESRIFDGQTIYEAESEIEVLYG